MSEDDVQPPRRFYAVSYEEDTNGLTSRGSLIPYKSTVPVPTRPGFGHYVTMALVPISVFLFIFTLGTLGAETITRYNLASLPEVTVINPQTSEVTKLNYGVELSLAVPSFFTETRDAFIDSAVTFIEVDLVDMQLRYFIDGVLHESFPVLAKGEEGSWWSTPSGLYKVEDKKEKFFSSLGQVYQPWRLAFESNLAIHGWPEYENGEAVAKDHVGGGIRLNTESAKRLYELVKLNTPILVYAGSERVEDFIYEPKVPEMGAPHYLIADIGNNTVLATSDLDDVVPIASLTKLMTALIATENIDLDTTVSIVDSNFVESLIPRLGERKKVSLYSLLQLLLVESSNEASEVIAHELGRDKFVALMNQRATELGMNQTQFADASGLSAGNVSTVSDLLRLTQYIYQNRRFIFDLTAKGNLTNTAVENEFGELINFNQVDGVTNFVGGKVGETLAAGQTSITLHRLKVGVQERILAVILLGSKQRAVDVQVLYRYAEERFSR